MSDWRKKDEWSRRGENFLVSVTHHTVERRKSYETHDGPHRWCVYAYIYPNHSHFAEFIGPNMWQEATQVMPLHGGCSLLEYPMYEGVVTSVKVGCDYSHLHDEYFSYMATQDDAGEVFRDADELHAWLQERAK